MRAVEIEMLQVVGVVSAAHCIRRLNMLLCYTYDFELYLLFGF